MTTRISGVLAEEHASVILEDGGTYTSKLSKPLYMIISPSHNLNPEYEAGTVTGGTAISYSLQGRTFTFMSEDGIGGTGYITIKGRL